MAMIVLDSGMLAPLQWLGKGSKKALKFTFSLVGAASTGLPYGENFDLCVSKKGPKTQAGACRTRHSDAQRKQDIHKDTENPGGQPRIARGPTARHRERSHTWPR
jgi:hypothetical protein